MAHTPDPVRYRYLALPGANSGTAIHLGRKLPPGSSDQPEGSAGRVIAFLFGLAPAGACRVSLLPREAGIVTVALVLALRRTGVTRQLTLWCPEVPRHPEWADPR